LGDLLLGFLTGFLNHTGSFFVLICLLALVLLFTTRWTLSGTANFSPGFPFNGQDGEIRVTQYGQTKKKEK